MQRNTFPCLRCGTREPGGPITSGCVTRSEAKPPTKSCAVLSCSRTGAQLIVEMNPNRGFSIFLLHLTIAVCLPHTTCISALYLDENRLATFSISWAGRK